MPVLVLVGTGETGQVPGAGDLASKPVAGDAKAAGCPSKTNKKWLKKKSLISE